MTELRIPQIEDYEPLIGRENVERIRAKAGRHFGHAAALIGGIEIGDAQALEPSLSD